MLNQQFLKAHPAHLIALGFGAGLSRLGAGTVGTLWAWASFLVIQLWLSPMEIGLLIGASTLIGWWACTITAKHLGVADPSAIFAQFAAFVLFRYFDIAKPGPVRWADQTFKGFGWRGGWGILFDDFVAAFCTLLVIALWRVI